MTNLHQDSTKPPENFRFNVSNSITVSCNFDLALKIEWKVKPLSEVGV